MNDDLDNAATIRNLQLRIDTTTDDDERERLQNTLAEVKGQSLAGAAHVREGGDASA